MTWGKGFYRVWLLLSAIWIGISVYAANPVTYSWLWKAPQYEIAFVTGNRIVLDTSKSHDELVAPLTAAMKKEAVDLKERDEILAGINSRYETAGEQAERVWLATFVPPVALLGFGLAIAWVLRGFRS